VPLNIMTGQAGHWMVSYQFMFEQMDGNLVGTDDISSGRILQSFAFSPTSMTMQMHMLMVMYAATDQLNFTIMVPYLRKNMNMLARDGSRFTSTAMASVMCNPGQPTPCTKPKTFGTGCC
jgi:hypothetical protein